MSNEVFPVNKHLLPINVNSMAQFNIAIEIINKELNKNISSKEFDRDFHIATDQLFCFLENNGIDTQLIAKTINKKQTTKQQPAKNLVAVDFRKYDTYPPYSIPESQGDFADQAQEQMESDIQEEVYRIRSQLIAKV